MRYSKPGISGWPLIVAIALLSYAPMLTSIAKADTPLKETRKELPLSSSFHGLGGKMLIVNRILECTMDNSKLIPDLKVSYTVDHEAYIYHFLSSGKAVILIITPRDKVGARVAGFFVFSKKRWDELLDKRGPQPVIEMNETAVGFPADIHYFYSVTDKKKQTVFFAGERDEWCVYEKP